MSKGGSEGPSQTPEEAELGKIAVERWNDYQRRFKPVENQFIEDVQANESHYDHALGATNTAVQQNFSQAEGDLKGNIFASGVDPSSSQFTDVLAGLSLDRGLTVGTGLNETEMSVDNRHLKGLQTVVQMGQGQATDALQGYGSIAGDATRDAIDRSYRSFQDKQAGLELAGTVAGAGYHAYSNREMTPNMQGQETPLYDNKAFVSNY
ncbi:hypothetical protein A3765_28530 [Oleiphilus sp. HI0130]|nr:hypothetical protein A3765_28755 [Oleiphilus sp. HI0130]KZZ72499.1 hypothetical protein A3765_28530 [Oleiphilus sp. HI0130]